MPPAKLTFHLVTSSGAHLLIMPDEDLELRYRLWLLGESDVWELVQSLGQAPTWMERLYYQRCLRARLPTRFCRVSPSGRFGFPNPDNGATFGTFKQGSEILFGREVLPFGAVEGMETWPEKRPFIGCLHLDDLPPIRQPPLVGTGPLTRAPVPDLMEVVKIDSEGRVYTKHWGVFTWQQHSATDPKRLTIPWGLAPEATYLVRCLNREDHFVAFFFLKRVLLVCPVKHHAAFYREGEKINPEELPLLLPDKPTALRLGFGRLLQFGTEWPTRMVEVITQGRPSSWRPHGKLVKKS
ncbi:MAG: hypothetical protein A2172_00925 [Candidatus Woykebacteria bacterium RBG_13_40_15]|uniref:Uncharacterized protein n=1 Tax=Candidatus Woykebacteria bacterium RBG_13_40_15 TaxID=1802593 RepID=A0A1G1W902_9BACT|nr:MAG: hypothetical protein A2172_00925 [Candidatus Woykebacteria bacterium RBG_13_40_15]